jgi:tRNA pseudouridine55 synthase
MIQKNNIDGIILLDKPSKLSSNQAIQKIKRVFNLNKIGHTGTLDPLATGLLPLCLGKATKIAQFLIDSDKTYLATIKLGVKTSTGDKEGEVIETSSVDMPDDSKVDQIIQSFVGKHEQIPPMYSALKFKGQRLYKLAIKGIDVPRKPRSIKINSIDIVAFNNDKIELIIECSKGTYIRTLAEDIASELQSVGHIHQLRRLNISCFSNQEMHNMDKIISSDVLDAFLLPIDSPLGHLKKIEICNTESSMFCNGLSISINLTRLQSDPYIRVYDDIGTFLGLGQHSNGHLKPRMVFNSMN